MISKKQQNMVLLMHNLHLRNVDDLLMLNLKQKAAEKSMSMNKFILMLLKGCVETTQNRITIRHDFDEFSGSWTTTENQVFKKNTAYFSEIDEAMWK